MFQLEALVRTMFEQGFLFAFNDWDDRSVLTAGIITLESFTGRVDLFSCRFEMPEDRAGAHFAVYAVDVTDPDGNPLSPYPLVGYRLE